eukprot:2150771-Heterocapsa_arctica.AAC.1
MAKGILGGRRIRDYFPGFRPGVKASLVREMTGRSNMRKLAVGAKVTFVVYVKVRANLAPRCARLKTHFGRRCVVPTSDSVVNSAE